MPQSDAPPELTAERLLRRHLEHFRRRVLYDALLEGTKLYWIHRAAVFEDACPRQGDYTGQATDDDLDKQTQRLTTIAVNCRNHAHLTAELGLDDAAQGAIDTILFERHGQVA